MILRLVRIVLIALGALSVWYGATLLWDSGTEAFRSIVFWFAAGILLHDGVFAPVCAALGLGARRVLPSRWWAPVACGAVCTVALCLVSLPVLTRGGAMPGNPSVLDRNYPAGLVVAVAVVWLLVAVALLAGRRMLLPTGQAGER
ncbi:hypothetical protein OG921_12285 [Aldersonia sp. NBC_00410]|uniref:hypothetical protein n=1 Tax=Aldersonia sp. NBC_00410 TaxID=2975954 RepID=UPI002259EFCA|nr:hypothetical protein [Aldersonia sp. NBC_00410]MCX5043946.1 hypothetical protein [Aldersonia sp. NBC_00410]